MIIKLLEARIDGKWNKGWFNIEGFGVAKNVATETEYNGFNQMFLSLITDFKGFSLNSWMTYNQAKNMGANIIKGSKSFPVVFWTTTYYDPMTKKRYQREDLNKLPSTIVDRLKMFSSGKHYNVFNVEQIEGLKDSFYEIPNLPPLTENFVKNDLAELVLHGVGANVNIKASQGAFYMPATDSITLPLREQFKGGEEFYKVAFHELSHWTGHKSRLNRDLKGMGAKTDYAFEELIAELGSVFVASKLGFNSDMSNSVEYLNSWLKCLKSDPEFIIKASQSAEKAANFIIAKYDEGQKTINKVG